MKRATKLASAATLGVGVVVAAGLTVATASSGDDGPQDDGADTAISATPCNEQARQPSPTPGKAESPARRSTTKRASTRSKSRWTTATRSTSSSTTSSASSATRTTGAATPTDDRSLRRQRTGNEPRFAAHWSLSRHRWTGVSLLRRVDRVGMASRISAAKMAIAAPQTTGSFSSSSNPKTATVMPRARTATPTMALSGLKRWGGTSVPNLASPGRSSVR